MGAVIVVLPALPLQGRVLRMKVFTVRKPKLVHLTVVSGATGYGVTLHRNGGVSLCGIPKSGGTTLAWGELKRRLDKDSRDVWTVQLGPVQLFVGRDF